jgi:[acyl-carrier-protein] S-malonyltransferase
MVAAGADGIAFVFPGQASQRAGMATALLAEVEGASDLFRQASEVLGLDLAAVCTVGDDALLTRTDIAQPALLTTCCAWLEALRARGVGASLLAGHSLGEFSAWVAAGALDFPEAVRLVRRRGELMEKAARQRPGSMVAVLGLPDEQVKELCARARSAGVVVAANFNCPRQVVVSGERAALEGVKEAAQAAGGKVVALRVSGAFHSPLMEDAALEFAGLVKHLALRDPEIPVVANATAEVVREAVRVREVMAAQMVSPVLWTDSVRRMGADGVRTFVEVGPGQVLTKLIRRIATEVQVFPVEKPEELTSLVQEIQQCRARGPGAQRRGAPRC